MISGLSRMCCEAAPDLHIKATAALPRPELAQHAGRQAGGCSGIGVRVPLVQGRCVGATWKPPLWPSSWLRMNDLPCIEAAG